MTKKALKALNPGERFRISPTSRIFYRFGIQLLSGIWLRDESYDGRFLGCTKQTAANWANLDVTLLNSGKIVYAEE